MIKKAVINDKEEDGARNPPDIFKAARQDDPAALASAKMRGESLAQSRPWSGHTPLHVAAIYGSSVFLRAALAYEDADPWIRDRGGKRPFEHAADRDDVVSMRLLHEAMYPEGQMPLPPPGPDDDLTP